VAGTKQSDKSRYRSKYSPDKFITGAQYILELLCENKATHENKQLPLYFWRHEDWKRFYNIQLRKVYKLVKVYGELPIINVLKNKKIKVFSVNHPKFEDYIKQESARLSNKEKLRKKTIYIDTDNEINIPEDKIAKLTKGRQKKQQDGLLDLI
jgi:hypothetical protein